MRSIKILWFAVITSRDWPRFWIRKWPPLISYKFRVQNAYNGLIKDDANFPARSGAKITPEETTRVTATECVQHPAYRMQGELAYLIVTYDRTSYMESELIKSLEQQIESLLISYEPMADCIGLRKLFYRNWFNKTMDKKTDEKYR